MQHFHCLVAMLGTLHSTVSSHVLTASCDWSLDRTSDGVFAKFDLTLVALRMAPAQPVGYLVGVGM